MWASYNGCSLEMVKVLIAAGADLNIKSNVRGWVYGGLDWFEW